MNSIPFYLITFFLFSVDLATTHLFEYPILNSLLCFFIFLCLNGKFTRNFIPIIAFIAGIDLITYGSSIPSLFFYSIAGILLFKGQQLFNTSLRTIFFGAVALLILAKTVIIDYCYYGLNKPRPYTAYEIFVNILVMFLLLKYMLKGKQGNRL
jgi:hypothetical protein